MAVQVAAITAAFCGTIFQFTSGGTLNILQSLSGGGSPLIRVPHGQLQFYGVGGGNSYSLVPGGNIVDLANVAGNDGNFYGKDGATVFNVSLRVR
jgi:hypothetical protein